MQKLTLTVINEVGLHARPAALFVEAAGKYAADIQVRNLTSDSDWVDAKSILSVLTLGVEQDHQIELSIEGDDEAQAAEALRKLIEANFAPA